MSKARLLVLAICVVCALAPAAATAAPTPKLAHPNATGRVLVVKFFTLLKHKDAAGLRTFLAPNFQIQRADGSSSGKAAYIAKLPTIYSFTITHVAATYANGALVVRYQAVATGLVNGKKYTPGAAPRLSVFTWNGSAWQLAAHANFNPLTG
ncbi:MAG TPA: nuclear transport factor 2 family protein [Gaiellaceae bacterium]|nr:nuclear transport factor 2 family protein [Gaiellaceae bacterium]